MKIEEVYKGENEVSFCNINDWLASRKSSRAVIRLYQSHVNVFFLLHS